MTGGEVVLNLQVKVPEVEAILEVAEMKVSEPQQYLKSGYLKPINVLNI